MSNFGGISGYLRDILKDQEEKKKATATPKPPKPPTPSYSNYGGGIAQEVKKYTPPTPTTPPKLPEATIKPTIPASTGSLSQDVRNLLPSNDYMKQQQQSSVYSTPSNQSSMYPTYYKDQSGGVVSGGNSRGSSSSSSRSSSSRSSGGGAAPTITTPKTFTPTYSAQPSGMPSEQPAAGTTYQGPQFIYDWSTSYRSELANLRDEELALAARLNDQFMRQLDQQIAQYKQYYEQMGQGVDPATEAALAKLREEMSNDQRMIMEYLNARGIAQSGIAAEEVGRLAGSYTDQKSQMIAQRLTDLQNQFLASMQNFMGQAVQGMGQYTQNAMGAQQRYAQGMQSAMENAMEKTFGAWQQEQQQRAQMEREMLPYTQGPTPYQQSQLNLQRQTQQQQYNLQQQQLQNAAQQQQAQAATNKVIEQIYSYPNREAVLADLQMNAAKFIQNGVDLDVVYKAIDRAFPVYTQYFGQ